MYSPKCFFFFFSFNWVNVFFLLSLTDFKLHCSLILDWFFYSTSAGLDNSGWGQSDALKFLKVPMRSDKMRLGFPSMVRFGLAVLRFPMLGHLFLLSEWRLSRVNAESAPHVVGCRGTWWNFGAHKKKTLMCLVVFIFYGFVFKWVICWKISQQRVKSIILLMEWKWELYLVEPHRSCRRRSVFLICAARCIDIRPWPYCMLVIFHASALIHESSL